MAATADEIREWLLLEVERDFHVRTREDGSTLDEPVDRKLFYAVADVIETYPYRYIQTRYGLGFDRVIYDGEQHTCGTMMCIAGYAAALRGYLPSPSNRGNPDDWATVLTADGQLGGTGHVAAYEFRLPPEDAALLFNERWRPRPDLTVPDALRAIGDGAAVADVTDPDALLAIFGE